jgi:hypothetical protein
MEDISQYTSIKHYYFLNGTPNLKKEIEDECKSEGGNIVVNGTCPIMLTILANRVVCGDPEFEQKVRSAVKETKRDIHLQYSDFLPER